MGHAAVCAITSEPVVAPPQFEDGDAYRVDLEQYH
jgi:hypothetical protein